MAKLAAGIWLLCALALGIIEYVTLLQPARDLADNGVRTTARLECAPAADCHHTNPFVYSYTVNGQTYTAPLVVGKGTHTDAYEPGAVALTYSPTNPRRWTFGSPASDYGDAIVQAIVTIAIGATLATACICACVRLARKD